MNLFVDLILLAIVLIGAYLGIKRGFIRMLAKPIRFVAVLALAITLCSGFAKAVVTPIISPSITGYVASFLYENASFITAENALEELPTLIKVGAAIAGLNIEEIVAGMSGTDLINVVVEKLTAPVVNIVAVIISFIALYFIGKVLVWGVIMLVDKIFSRGIFGLVNKTLGAIFATVFAFLISWAFAVILELVFHLPMFESNELICNFDGGVMYRFFNNYNPIELLLSF